MDTNTESPYFTWILGSRLKKSVQNTLYVCVHIFYVCLPVCMYVYICTCVYMHMKKLAKHLIYVYIYTLYVYVPVCMYMYIYVHMYMHVFVCISVCVYKCWHVCIYIYVYTHRHIYTDLDLEGLLLLHDLSMVFLGL